MFTIDLFGNYFVHELVKRSDESNLALIVETIIPDFISLAKSDVDLSFSFIDSNGTYVIQTIVDSVSSSVTQATIIDAIRGHEIELATHFLGLHVLKRCLARFQPDLLVDIISLLTKHELYLAKDRCGVILLRTLYDTAPSAIQNTLRYKAFETLSELITDNYGFFFIQHLITAGNKYFMDSRKYVIDFLSSDLHSFLNNKNACSIIEKCITLCGMERINLIVCLCKNPEYFIDDAVSNLVRF